MNGIPLEIMIDGDQEIIYLATRASGETGVAMMAAKRGFHKAEQAMARAFVRVSVCSSRAAVLDAEAANYDGRLLKLLDEQDAAAERAEGFRDEALQCSIDLVRMSLTENYSADQTERYLNVLTDLEINQCVGIIESGDVPEDFMKSRGIRPSGSSTTPADAGHLESSSDTDLPRPGSEKES